MTTTNMLESQTHLDEKNVCRGHTSIVRVYAFVRANVFVVEEFSNKVKVCTLSVHQIEPWVSNK